MFGLRDFLTATEMEVETKECKKAATLTSVKQPVVLERNKMEHVTRRGEIFGNKVIPSQLVDYLSKLLE